MTGLPDLSGRVAVVTGASRGIGYATSVALARAGAHVIAVARTVGGLEDLDDAITAEGGSATLVPCDLKDGGAVDRLGGAIFERWKKLDILFANAGMLGPLTPLPHVKPKQWDEIVATNLTANWRLIRSLDPLLRASDAGRAVFMTTGATYAPRPYWGPYAITKMALEQMALTYALEVASSPLRVNLVNPGPIRTAMRAQAMPGEDPASLKTPADIAPKIVALLAPGFSGNGLIYDYPRDAFLVRPEPQPAG
ncbi:MAG: SDR family NAD(P)-dependent oxidoreductase [Rhodobiaceae bacterium]|nr:SDR family NAD(P)-dependent oxidoreductase [Rhodobiaceae bacterium]MCC0053046.1 SDR family NAD(P)-dependent oxidoreductase [Rhodobiaceae bacterium]